MERTALAPRVDRRTVAALISRLRSANGQADPRSVYTKLLALGPVVPAPWGGYLANSYEACDEVLRRSRQWLTPDTAWRNRQENAAERWNNPSSVEWSRSLPGLNPPEHTQQRSVPAGYFGRTALEALQEPIERISERLLDRLEGELAHGEADFATLVSERLPVSVIGHWLGLPPEDYDELIVLTHDQALPQELVPTKSQLAQADRSAIRLVEYIADVVRARRERPGDDAVSDWLRMWDSIEPDREQADRNVHHLAKFVVMAALETTSSVLSTVIWLLDQNPEQRAWLRAHPEDVPSAVEECLRYDAPVHVHGRIAAEDTELAGVPVARGEMVHVMIGAAHHDPAQYPDPGTFDIHRGGSHLAFGGGVHYCLGAPLARMEAAVLVRDVLRRFPTLRVTAPPTWVSPRAAFRYLAALPVAVR
ncbi:cytochrome P450 [Streptomyces chumphonensis]|uniref:Cytochrome P450 n=1 Tax=Streptomyces chumphonensis TaxID=1214925 RepID=A0A927EWY6_9ACTN|nr:cytochrome P450 [Streptomyces chumphonensis]MBD3930276.1 cytochrome P450 [Streptomyces chumphonensis]